MQTDELTARLAQHIASTTYEQLPAQAVRGAQRSLLDALGVSIAASGLEPACQPYAALATDCPGPCSILGYRKCASPLMAAFANGALAHALDFEDAYDAAPAHPNAASVPVALALAEHNPGIDGPQLLTALAVGSDLVCRLAAALPDNPDRYGFYTPAILNTFGAAATAAKLLALDQNGVGSVLALALSQSMSSSQFKLDASSPVRAVREAFPARAGLTSALLVQRGAGGFGGSIGGRYGLYAAYARSEARRSELLDGLGTRFLGAQMSYKPWPSCRGTHAFIEAAFVLKRQHGLAADDIVRIEARGAPLNRMLMEPADQKRRPRLAIDAKFSLPFCIGSALVHDGITLDSFTAPRLSDPRVLALAEKVVFVEQADRSMHRATGGELELQQHNGERYKLGIEYPLGHPRNSLDEPALIAKFVDCLGRGFEPIEADTAVDAAQAILCIESAASAAEALKPLLAAADSRHSPPRP